MKARVSLVVVGLVLVVIGVWFGAESDSRLLGITIMALGQGFLIVGAALVMRGRFDTRAKDQWRYEDHDQVPPS